MEVPSVMDKPDLRIGTRDIVSGVTVVVVYSYPRCVVPYTNVVSHILSIL